MTRLPKGHKAQIAGLRVLQTMYTAEQMRQVIAAEREACAKVCDVIDDGRKDLSAECAEAIRARGQA
jgi:hypothetical protein